MNYFDRYLEGLNKLETLTDEERGCPFVLYSIAKKYDLSVDEILCYCAPVLQSKILVLDYYTNLDILHILACLNTQTEDLLEDEGDFTILMKYLNLDMEQTRQLIYDKGEEIKEKLDRFDKIETAVNQTNLPHLYVVKDGTEGEDEG